MDQSHGKTSQLAEPALSLVEELKQGSPDHESLHPVGQAAGVGPWETTISGIQLKERGTIHHV